MSQNKDERDWVEISVMILCAFIIVLTIWAASNHDEQRIQKESAEIRL